MRECGSLYDCHILPSVQEREEDEEEEDKSDCCRCVQYDAVASIRFHQLMTLEGWARGGGESGLRIEEGD